jgi:hypothetical protein
LGDVTVIDKTPSAYHTQELQVKFLVLTTWFDAKPLLNLLKGYRHQKYFFRIEGSPPFPLQTTEITTSLQEKQQDGRENPERPSTPTYPDSRQAAWPTQPSRIPREGIGEEVFKNHEFQELSSLISYIIAQTDNKRQTFIPVESELIRCLRLPLGDLHSVPSASQPPIVFSAAQEAYV